MIKVTNEVREAARRLLTQHNEAEAASKQGRQQKGLLSGDDRSRIKAIVEGQRKLINADWWRKVYGDIDRAKLDKIAAMADPARNSSEHERQVASTKLAAAKGRRAPGLPPESPPLPENLSEWIDRRKTKVPPTPQRSRRPSDSVAAHASDSVATIKRVAQISEAQRRSDSVSAAPTSDSVAAARASASVAPSVKPVSDSVASAPDSGLKALNARRAAQRAANRASLKCQTCGKPLAARRVTARYCNATCRSQAWRKSSTSAR